MPRTISDDDWNRLQARLAQADQDRQINQFIESVYNDPALNKDAKRLIKRKYPNLQIPDLDIEDRIDARFAEEQQRREQTEAAAREEAEQRRWQEERSNTQKQYGFTDEAMTDLEKMMVEKNVGSYDVAASYKAQKDPKPVEATFDNYRWHHEKQPGFADIAKDPEGWGRSEIMKALRADQEREQLPWPVPARR